MKELNNSFKNWMEGETELKEKLHIQLVKSLLKWLVEIKQK